MFFKALKGYYSEIFSLGIIRTGQIQLKLIQHPLNLLIGEKWVFDSAYGEKAYQIINKKANTLVIQSGSETINVEIEDGHYNIEKITVCSGGKEESKGLFSIKFSPTLPILLGNSDDDQYRQIN